MTPTDTQLKQALAKLLPDILDTEWTGLDSIEPKFYGLVWRRRPNKPVVIDTELLHLCWLVEGTILNNIGYCRVLLEVCLPETEGVIVGLNAGYGMSILHATWQQRTIALAKVKGIEI